MKIAFIFPGQGSQFVGMGKELYDRYEIVREYYDRADRKLGTGLKKLMFEGPKEELTLTYNAQPAILTMSVALYKLMQSTLRIEPEMCMGHSVGEYSALTAVSALSFEDAVYAVRKRGEAMQAAVKPGQGTMAAVVGIDESKIKEILTHVQADTGAIVEVANYNSREQIVISGHTIAVDYAMDLLRSHGARLVKKLDVSAPFHSSLMEPAVVEMQKVLNDIKLNSMDYPVVFNVDATVHPPHDIAGMLLKQLVSPVRWVDTIIYAIQNGVDTFVEIGPGKVLTGLVKRINSSVRLFNVNDPATLEQLHVLIQ
ncbi:MAG: ACP S-malonyltransferase [Deltaproteobacteria bacterium]|nr:ACP S-malonyltransferase [Deltaproteobacteria bacterium]